MELSLLMRLRIAASATAGVVLIGILAWPLATSLDPQSAVLAGNISIGGKMTLVVLSFLTGLIGYFVSWPYGREIGILAVPSGLAVWAGRSASMTTLMQLNPSAEQRHAVFSAFKWDSAFWLLLVAAGFFGVFLGQKIASKPRKRRGPKKSDSRSAQYLSAVIASVGSVFIAHLGIKMFARDISLLDSKLGTIISQPSTGQIVFAVFVSFGIAAFIVKKFLEVSYIWPAIATVFLTIFAVSTYAKKEVLLYFAQQWPGAFFVNATISILPVQLVALGTLGSVAGYWMAVRYSYWHKNEMK
jgi:hypothetical protein